MKEGNAMSDNNPHPGYVPPAIADDMPGKFSYVGRPGTDRGLRGQAVTPRYHSENDDDD
jgi:hypothetical protein